MPDEAGVWCVSRLVNLRKVIRIHIGEYHASRNPVVIYTLLGSCVSACLYDPVSRVGGMNHILMPGQADMKHFDASARYGVNAMELLINRIMNLGGKRSRLVAKIFGGARTITTIPEEHGMGKKNIEFIMEFMKNESIRILSQDIGGGQLRKLYFYTHTGEVFLKRGRPLQLTGLVSLERKAQDRINRDIEKPGAITLF